MLASILKFWTAIKIGLKFLELIETEYESYEVTHALEKLHESVVIATQTRDTTLFEDFISGASPHVVPDADPPTKSKN